MLRTGLSRRLILVAVIGLFGAAGVWGQDVVWDDRTYSVGRFDIRDRGNAFDINGQSLFVILSGHRCRGKVVE